MRACLTIESCLKMQTLKQCCSVAQPEYVLGFYSIADQTSRCWRFEGQASYGTLVSPSISFGEPFGPFQNGRAGIFASQVPVCYGSPFRMTTHHWDTMLYLTVSYMHLPPIPLLKQVPKKLTEEKVQVILVAPSWPTQTSSWTWSFQGRSTTHV